MCPVASVGGQQSCGEVSPSNYTYAAPLKGPEQLSRIHILHLLHYTQKDANSQTIIITCMPMVNMIMASSGVNHHDLYNMHNYM